VKIAALDSSGLVATVAYLEDDKIKGSININYQKTHSQTLLPMFDELVKTLDIDLNEIDYFAIANGPGSFTGLRIGVATVKGLALSLNKKVVPVSTLEALAVNWLGVDKVICPIMDARRSQVYTAAYIAKDDPLELEELISPVNCNVDELCKRLNEIGQEVFFTGDGVPVYREFIENELKVKAVFPEACNAYQNAAKVAILAKKYAERGLAFDAKDITPVYLRKPQAEREREALNGVSN